MFTEIKSILKLLYRKNKPALFALAYLVTIIFIALFKHLNKTNQRLREKGKVYEAIKLHGPTTSRKLAYITGIERSSVCRALFDKLREITPAIKESHIAKCETTGIKVKHYSVIDFILEGGKHG